jgi:hypothetical protein
MKGHFKGSKFMPCSFLQQVINRSLMLCKFTSTILKYWDNCASRKHSSYSLDLKINGIKIIACVLLPLKKMTLIGTFIKTTVNTNSEISEFHNGGTGPWSMVLCLPC